MLLRWNLKRPKKYGIKEAIFHDDEEKFIELVKRQLWKDNSDNTNSKFCPSEILGWICEFDAGQCAFALLSGETGLSVDLNLPLKDGMFPIHHAALSLSPGLTELFLQNGAQANVRCNDVGCEFYGVLPLNLALKDLRQCIAWTPEESILKLVVALRQSEMKFPLETISFLAKKTPELLDVAYHCAEEGNIVQLAALLTVAPSMYTESEDESEDDCSLDGSMNLRQCVANEIASLIDVEYKLKGRGRSELVQMCNKKKKVMISVMLLLEFFSRGGYELSEEILLCPCQFFERYLETKYFEDLLNNTGYFLKDEDAYLLKDKDCFDDTSKHRECESQPKDLSLPSYLQPHSPLITQKLMMSIQQQRCSLGKLGLSSLVQSFHTLRSVKASAESKLYTIIGAQHVPTFLSSKKWCSFALAIKRGIRHV